MGTNASPPAQQPPPYGPGSYMSILRVRGHKPPPSKRNRVFWWVFLASQMIFLGWVVYAGVSHPQNGIGIQMGLWIVTDVILVAIYLVCQLPRRPR
jgi:hypothetical protein